MARHLSLGAKSKVKNGEHNVVQEKGLSGRGIRRMTYFSLYIFLYLLNSVPCYALLVNRVIIIKDENMMEQ